MSITISQSSAPRRHDIQPRTVVVHWLCVRSGEAVGAKQGIGLDGRCGRIQRPGIVAHVGVAKRPIGRLGVKAVALDEELRERVRRGVERFAGRPVGGYIPTGTGTGVVPPAVESYATIGYGKRDAGVVVREVVEQARAGDTGKPLSVQAEEVDAGDAVVGDVRSDVDFRETNAESAGKPLRPDGDISERDDREPRTPVMAVSCERFGEMRVHQCRVDGPVLEQQLPPAHHQRDHHVFSFGATEKSPPFSTNLVVLSVFGITLKREQLGER